MLFCIVDRYLCHGLIQSAGSLVFWNNKPSESSTDIDLPLYLHGIKFSYLISCRMYHQNAIVYTF